MSSRDLAPTLSTWDYRCAELYLDFHRCWESKIRSSYLQRRDFTAWAYLHIPTEGFWGWPLAHKLSHKGKGQQQDAIMNMMWKHRYQRERPSLKLVSECVIWKGGCACGWRAAEEVKEFRGHWATQYSLCMLLHPPWRTLPLTTSQNCLASWTQASLSLSILYQMVFLIHHDHLQKHTHHVWLSTPTYRSTWLFSVITWDVWNHLIYACFLPLPYCNQYYLCKIKTQTPIWYVPHSQAVNFC